MIKKFTLSPYVEIQYFDKKLYFSFGSIEKIIENNDIINSLVILLDKCLKPITKKELIEFASQNEKSYNEALNILFSNNYLIPEDGFDKNDRNSRSNLFYYLNSADPKEVNKNLNNSNVVFIGGGGIGNIIALNLAIHDVRKITIIDDDIIELSNLTRQIMFTEKDVGKYKVDILKREIKKRNSNCKVKAIKKSIKTINDLENLKLKNVSLIVLSGDESGLLQKVNTFCINNSVPFIHSGYINDIAVYGPIVEKGKTGCWECENHVISNEKIPDNILKLKEIINSRIKNPSIGPVNMIAGSLASLDILKFLGKFGNVQTINKRFGLHTYKNEFEIQNYNINKNCKNCGR